MDMVREEIPVILLVGGLGMRLQPILQSTPKPLARVGDTAFLELLVRQLRSQGFRRLVMCTGHLAGQIEKEFGDGHKWDVAIEYSEESRPLGTAGAVKFAERHLAMDSDFLVMNGDSFMEIDIREFIRFHREHRGLISMAVRRVPDASRFGTVEVDAQKRIVGFREKMGMTVPGIINAGVYLFNRAMLKHIPAGPASLEKDIFPGLLERGVYALEQHGMFIDIGTPEDYARAQELYGNLAEAALFKPEARIERRAVFLDRDGVINQKPPEGDYVTRWEDFRILPGVVKGIALLKRAGFRVIVVTNQRCVAKGLMSVAELEKLHQRMSDQLARDGAAIDGIYYCPHEMEPPCNCRKPAPGMLLDAAREHGIELGTSWIIGDSDIDIEAGRSAGCKTAFLLATDETAGETKRAGSKARRADVVAASLLDAISEILHWERAARPLTTDRAAT